jgi:hypothetical protein
MTKNKSAIFEQPVSYQENSLTTAKLESITNREQSIKCGKGCPKRGEDAVDYIKFYMPRDTQERELTKGIVGQLVWDGSYHRGAAWIRSQRCSFLC